MRFRAAIALLPFALTLATAAQAERAAEASTESADASSAEAQDSAAAAATAPDDAADDKSWHFATIGYVYFAGVKGQTDVIGPVPPVDLDMSFGDILKNFKFAFMGAADARHDRLVFVGDLMWVHIGGDAGIGIRDPDFLHAELDSRTWAVTATGGYRIANDGPVKLDLLAGGRLNGFKTTLQLTGPNREAKGEVQQTWLDPIVAARALVPLGGKWGASFYGDVGGFGIASDITWQLVGGITYQVNHKLKLGAGWRTFKVHYDKGDFLYDAAQNGPLIIFRTDF